MPTDYSPFLLLAEPAVALVATTSDLSTEPPPEELRGDGMVPGTSVVERHEDPRLNLSVRSELLATPL